MRTAAFDLAAPASPTEKPETEEHTYKVDKMVFLVTPSHRKDSDKTIHEALINLMIKDSENH
ncbi:MAG: hypothetical protein FWH04_10000 [Oscillospiraceae bacterium]|nr:hypothetical protein [Oscillospiraceae bacterium]